MQKLRTLFFSNTPCTPVNKSARPAQLWLVLVSASLVALSPYNYAVGLGGSQVRSALGQPLSVAIDIVNTKGNVPVTCFALARDMTNGSDGIPFITQGHFKLEGKGKSAKLLFISGKTINDPIVKLAVLSTCGDRNRREYTIMLDPQKPSDGKVVPLPLAPTGEHSSAATPSKVQTPEIPHLKPSSPEPSPNVKPINKTSSIHSPKESAPSSVENTRPGELSAAELAAYEQAIAVSHKNLEKKKSLETSIDSAEEDNDDASDTKVSVATKHGGHKSNTPSTASKHVRLSVSDNEPGNLPHPKIEPKLSIITELSSLEKPSSGINLGEPHTLSPEDRAAILAKVERVVNAPLEHDISPEELAKPLPKSPKTPPETAPTPVITPTPSPYQRYIEQRTKNEMEQKLKEAEQAAADKRTKVTLLFMGGAIALLGLWWRNRSKSNTISIKQQHNDPSFPPQKNGSHQNVTPLPSTGEHNQTKEEPFVGKQFPTEPVFVPMHSKQPSNTDLHSTPFTLSKPETKIDKPISEAPSTPTNSIFKSAFTPSSDFPIDSPQDKEFLFHTPEKNDTSKELPYVEIPTSSPIVTVDDSPSISNAEHKVSVAIEKENAPTIPQEDLHPNLKPTPLSPAETLAQGQSVIAQATQYLHAQQADLAFSYLESSIEWLPAAPQPWILLLSLYAEQYDKNSAPFHITRQKFTSLFQGVEDFSYEDLLTQPPMTENNPRYSALEQCAPLFLSQIMQDWDKPASIQTQLEQTILHDLQSKHERFSFDSIQELLFLYNLSIEKSATK